MVRLSSIRIFISCLNEIVHRLANLEKTRIEQLWEKDLSALSDQYFSTHKMFDRNYVTRLI